MSSPPAKAIDEVKIGFLAKLLIHNLRQNTTTLTDLDTTEFPTIYKDIYKEKARRLVAEKTDEMIDIIRSECPLINTDIMLKDVIRSSLLRDLGTSLDITYLREKAKYAGERANIGYNIAVAGFADGGGTNITLGGAGATRDAAPYAAAASAAAVVNYERGLPTVAARGDLVIKADAAAQRATIGYNIAVAGFADGGGTTITLGGTSNGTNAFAAPYAAAASAAVIIAESNIIDPANSSNLVIKADAAAQRATLGYGIAVVGFNDGGGTTITLGGTNDGANASAAPYAAAASAAVIIAESNIIDPANSTNLVIKADAAAQRATLGYGIATAPKKFAAAIAAGTVVVTESNNIDPAACASLVIKANDAATYAGDDANFRKDGYIQSYIISNESYTTQLNTIASMLQTLPETTSPDQKQLLVGGVPKKKSSSKKKSSPKKKSSLKKKPSLKKKSSPKKKKRFIRPKTIKKK